MNVTTDPRQLSFNFDCELGDQSSESSSPDTQDSCDATDSASPRQMNLRFDEE